MTTDIEVAVPRDLQTRVFSLAVVDDESRAEAQTCALECKERQKQIKAYFAELKDNANKVHKDICAREKAALAPWEALEKDAVRKRLAYDTAKAEAQREAQEAARKAAEAERAEQSRIVHERMKEAELARKFGDDEGAAVAEAEAHQAAVQSRAALAVAKVVPGKPAGTREKRCWRVTDAALIPREFLIPDAETLNFRASKKFDCPIPGIEFYVEYIPVTRG